MRSMASLEIIGHSRKPIWGPLVVFPTFSLGLPNLKLEKKRPAPGPYIREGNPAAQYLVCSSRLFHNSYTHANTHNNTRKWKTSVNNNKQWQKNKLMHDKHCMLISSNQIRYVGEDLWKEKVSSDPIHSFSKWVVNDESSENKIMALNL